MIKLSYSCNDGRPHNGNGFCMNFFFISKEQLNVVYMYTYVFVYVMYVGVSSPSDRKSSKHPFFHNPNI